IYYLLATTVHPWYISMLLILGVMSGRVYPVAWTGAVFLSYITYRTVAYQENYWFILIEYAIIAIVFLKPAWIKQWLSSAR
ncbi:MAG: glycosyltransferase ArnT-like protein, partial [Salibacteraceae bacterium]|nr:glycosyltransferase ArnT-like protein [Salibacteraceae bacterium]